MPNSKAFRWDKIAEMVSLGDLAGNAVGAYLALLERFVRRTARQSASSQMAKFIDGLPALSNLSADSGNVLAAANLGVPGLHQ